MRPQLRRQEDGGWFKGRRLESFEGSFTQMTDPWLGGLDVCDCRLQSPLWPLRHARLSQHGGFRLLTGWPGAQSMNVPVSGTEASSPFIPTLGGHAASPLLQFSDKKQVWPWPDGWVGTSSCTQNTLGSIPGLGTHRRQSVDVLSPLSSAPPPSALSFSSSLKSIKGMSSGEG